MKHLYRADERRATPGQVDRAKRDAAKAEKREAQRPVMDPYKVDGCGASLGIIRVVLADVVMLTREFCEAHHLHEPDVLPELVAAVVAHVQTYGLSGRDELLGVTTRLLRAYRP